MTTLPEKKDEICISYDLKTRSVAFYNTATKNRIRYNVGNFTNLLGVMKHIDSVKPVIHWPLKCHPLRIFIGNVRYLNQKSHTMDDRRRDTEMRLFWDSLWNQMSVA